MGTRTLAPAPAHWEVAEAIRLRNREVRPGVVLKIAGERGTFRFEQHVLNTRTGTEWITVRDANGGWRSFRPERVRSIPRRQGRAA